jgi:hypothetical protein
MFAQANYPNIVAIRIRLVIEKSNILKTQESLKSLRKRTYDDKEAGENVLGRFKVKNLIRGGETL